MKSYAYKVENNITGEFYFGSRCRNVAFKRNPVDDFWKYYFTSSKKVKFLIKEYGKDSFTTTILLTSDSFDECYRLEQNLIKEHIKNPKNLNSHYIDLTNGSQKFSTKDKNHSDATKEKIKNSHKIRDPQKESLRIEKQKITKATRTAEEKRRHSEKISNGRANMSPEAKASRIEKQSESMRLYHSKRKQAQ